MITKIYSVYDAQAKAHIPPFFMHQDGMATRIFGQMINDPQHQFSKSPEDYTLFYIGQFDDETAVIETGVANSLGNGLQFVQETPQIE